MKERFEGASGRENLVEALKQKRIVGGHFEIVSCPANEAEILQVHPNNSRQTLLAFRTKGKHVGEMALPDTASKRSPSLSATEKTAASKEE